MTNSFTQSSVTLVTKKILVIEDEESVRANLIDLLELEDFEVIEATNGLIGIQLAQEELPDLILCDVSMPELDGFAVLEKLRQNSETATIPLIFLTAHSTPADFRQGMRLGADDYLFKPFSQSDLLEAIDTRLAKHAAITQPYERALEEVTAEFSDHLYHDPVTCLPTRFLLQKIFNQISINQLNLTVLSLKIDRFDTLCSYLKNTQDDALLCNFAQRLMACVDSSDIISRLGDDQFVILLTTRSNSQGNHLICQRILTSLAQPFKLDKKDIFLTVSIGITLFPEHGIELNSLMRKADLVVRDIQQRGGGQYQFYTSTTVQQVERLELEISLRRALENSEFQVHYQPQIDLQTGKVSGAEALIRWQNHRHGIVPPSCFIPLAEEIGLIGSIGEWVLQKACQETQTLRNAGFSTLRIAVNLAAQQFSQTQLTQILLRVLQSTHLDASALELELTETALLQNETKAITTLNDLKDLGVQIAIDDFGTGYASLSYLKQFPFDILKIDRCFIRNVHSESYNNAITTAVLQMAKQLNLEVVAEGVEKEEELAFLRDHCCHKMQGFLFSRPLPITEYAALLAEERCLF